MPLLNPFRIGQGVLGQQLGPYPYGTLGPDKVPYWDGNEFKIPQFTPQPWTYAPPQAPSTAALDPNQPSSQINAGILASMYGDGGAGNGLGGGKDAPGPNNSPDMSEAGHVNAADTQAMMGGIPSLPDFKEATAPAAPTAPAQGLAVSEVDPQGPSGVAAGKGKSAASQESRGVNAGHQTGVLSRSSLDKAIQEKGLIDALKDAMQQTAPAVGFNTTTDSAEAAAAAAAESAGPAGVPGSEQNSPNAVGGAMGGNNGNNGPGPSGADGKSGTGPNAGDEGGLGAWREGGRTGGDKDANKDEMRGVTHEFEFNINRPMTTHLDKVAPGLLNKIDALQKKMLRKPGLLHR